MSSISNSSLSGHILVRGQYKPPILELDERMEKSRLVMFREGALRTDQGHSFLDWYIQLPRLGWATHYEKLGSCDGNGAQVGHHLTGESRRVNLQRD